MVDAGEVTGGGMFSLINKYADKKLARFCFLVFLAVVGLVLGVIVNRYSECLDCLLGEKGAANLTTVMIGLPVFAALWWFRTRDVRQNIEQTNLFNGLQFLASDNPLKIDIGVHQLLRLSEAVPEYYPDIRIAFIRRLKISPKPEDEISMHDARLAYAQHIFKWLMKKEQNYDKSDYKNIDIFHQDFSEPGLFLKIQKDYGANINEKNVMRSWKIFNVGVPESEIKEVKINHCNIFDSACRTNQYRPI